jgi:hypothetical protein
MFRARDTEPKSSPSCEAWKPTARAIAVPVPMTDPVAWIEGSVAWIRESTASMREPESSLRESANPQAPANPRNKNAKVEGPLGDLVAGILTLSFLFILPLSLPFFILGRVLFALYVAIVALVFWIPAMFLFLVSLHRSSPSILRFADEFRSTRWKPEVGSAEKLSMRCVILPSEMKKVDDHKKQRQGRTRLRHRIGQQIRRAARETVRDAVMPGELAWDRKRRAEMAGGAD